MVGEAEVTDMNETNELPEGAGETEALKPKENFEPVPHPRGRFVPGRGYVYFIRVGSYIKIGFSTRPLDRIRSLQTSHYEDLKIVGTLEASRDFEGELHAHFADLRVRGEWFHAVDPLLTYIEEKTREGQARAARRELPPPLPLEIKAMIGKLIRFRAGVGAETPDGYSCSNLAVLLAKLPTYVRPAWATHPTQTLQWRIDYQMKRLAAGRAA